MFAYLGLLDDAAPLFRPGTHVPRAGVLLAIPALHASGVLDCARDVYGSLGPAFYGLRTSLVALLLMALCASSVPRTSRSTARWIPRPRARSRPRSRGQDPAPQAAPPGRAGSCRRLRSGAWPIGAWPHAVLRSASCTSMGTCAPTTANTPSPRPTSRDAHQHAGHHDYWVNDVAGEPLFVVTAEANAGLVKVLPPVLAEIRELVGERRVTVVFDRGGWSPKLFQQMIGRASTSSPTARAAPGRCRGAASTTRRRCWTGAKFGTAWPTGPSP